MTHAVAKEEARALWRSARSLEELCELGARFVEGELPLFPGWGSTTLDPESDPHARDLALLNRAGFLTVASQPGGTAQRAFVFGFATSAMAERIERAAGAAGLVCARFLPGKSGGDPVPVTCVGDEPRVFAGRCDLEAEIECFREQLGPAGLAALALSHWVSVHDPVWGRGPVLWDALRRAARGAEA